VRSSKVRGVFRLLLLCAAFSACPSSPAPVCNAQSCSQGCCDAFGNCVSGRGLRECGRGQLCVGCASNQACIEQQCSLIPGANYDGGFDADPDASVRDAGRFDASVPDAGVDGGRPDAGSPDAGIDGGRLDGGTTDAGRGDGGSDGGPSDAGNDGGGIT
jgi:hypothetical protein